MSLPQDKKVVQPKPPQPSLFEAGEPAGAGEGGKA